MTRIYISHPYTSTGEADENVRAAREIQKEVQKEEPDANVICVLGAMPFVGTYKEQIMRCLDELDTCDIIMFCGRWKESRGCLIEYGYAVAKDKKIIFRDEVGK